MQPPQVEGESLRDTRANYETLASSGTDGICPRLVREACVADAGSKVEYSVMALLVLNNLLKTAMANCSPLCKGIAALGFAI